ncbi:MAG: hypothetical protein AB7D51_07160 [Desulfovibrionaceae bacterium]
MACIAIFLWAHNNARRFHEKYKHSTMAVGEEYLFEADDYTGSRIAPNMSFHQRLEYSSMTLFTNDRGERCFSCREKATPKPLVLLGDSFVMGSGNDYEDCFAGILEKEYGLNMANLGVGTFSILQAVRHFERNVGFHSPKAAVFVYGHWMVDRAFKDNAFMNGLGKRPVYVRAKRTGKIFVVDPVYAPGTSTLRTLHSLRNGLIGPHRFNIAYVLRHMHLSLIVRRIRFLRKLLGLLRLYRYKLINDHENRNEELRARVLRDCIGRMAEVAAKHRCKLLVYHMFEYRCYDERKAVAAYDDSVIREVAALHENVVFDDGSAEHRRFDEYMHREGLTGDYFDVFKLPDDIHHARPGNELIAESLFEVLMAHGMAYRKS